MARSVHPKLGKKSAKPYHHGDLRRALLDEALRTIQTHGVEQLTLRTVGERLGVSRSALYRHFADKQSLLAAVGKEGFRMLRQAVADAWEQNGRSLVGFQAMGKAYIQFAVAHPSHYRVMFGGFIESAAKDDHFLYEAKAAFRVLVDALVEQQNAGDIRRDDPVLMGRFVWALFHGTAMLFIDGQLPETAQRDSIRALHLREALRIHSQRNVAGRLTAHCSPIIWVPAGVRARDHLVPARLTARCSRQRRPEIGFWEITPGKDRSYRKCAGGDTGTVDESWSRRTFDKTVSGLICPKALPANLDIGNFTSG
jgi:AcrR family transcriptional regulator